MSADRQIRYAVVGAGNIAQVAVLPAFEHARDNSRAVAVISADPAKRSALRRRYGLEIDGDYESFEHVMREGSIDAVYITTPNSLHREYAVRAANAGVHVLCEKPLAPTVDDCVAIEEACRENGVKAMVAYRLHFEEANLTALDIARSGTLGELQLFSSVFSHVVRPDDIRRKAELAGGAMYDLGVYCINAARSLFGDEPISVFADTVESNDTDDRATAILTFPGARLAQFCISNSTASTSSYRIAGTRGDLRVEPAFDYGGDLVHHLTVGAKTVKRTFPKRDQFAPELVYFSDCILHDAEPEPSVEEGIADIRVIEALLESARGGREVTLAPFERRRHPSIGQEMHFPPVERPEPVHAPGPSLR